MPFNLPGVKPGSDIESLFKAVGFVVVQWGCAEQALDLIVTAVFHRLGGNSLVKRPPRMLSAKLDFLRKCFRQLPGLEQFKAESDALLFRFAATGKKRNDLVHGAITNLSIKNDAFIFTKIDVEPDGHALRPVALDQSEFPRLIKDLLRLGSDAIKLSHRIWESTKAHR